MMNVWQKLVIYMKNSVNKRAKGSRNFKVLLIYPSLFMQIGLPLGIASLAAALKEKGIEVRVFDTVFYQLPGDIDENVERATVHKSFKTVDYESLNVVKNDSDVIEDFKKTLEEFEPDLVGMSSIECIFERGLRLTKVAKEMMDVPVVAGGVFATLAPEVVIKEGTIDIACIGEGEDALVELCECLQEGKDHSGIKGLWVKKDGKIIKNGPRQLKGLDEMVRPDFSVFDPRMFYKPMQGNLFKTIPVEITRGCPFMCTYCAAPALNKLYKDSGGGKFFRNKSPETLFSEINESIEKYSPEFFYFASETFLAIDDVAFNNFIENYRHIRIPFWIQTRVETITYERIQKLKEVGLFWMTIGVEHGSEEYRNKYLKRYTKNEKIIEVVKILDKCDQGASLNNIIGLPFETRELIYETIMLNRKLFKLNNRLKSNVSIFTPYKGCELYDLCISNKLLDPAPYTNHTNIVGDLPLRSNLLTDDEINGLFRTFNLYVYLPDEHLDRIRLAESFTPEGNREFELLNEKVGEYM